MAPLNPSVPLESPAPAESRSPGAWRVWWSAARPRTLPVAVAPVAVGTAIASNHGGVAAGPALAALGGALLLQVVANLANDVFDFERGADTEERSGPPRATQQGWVTPLQMKAAIVAVLGAVLAIGLYLIWVGGWPIAAIGAFSMLAALAYTAGPYPLGYHGLGELAVIACFGVVAVTGTVYVQTLTWPGVALAASLPVASLAAAILVVNNLRDRETDARVGKRTLAVRLGPRGSVVEYALLLFAPYAALPLIWASGAAGLGVLLPLATLPLALRLLRSVARERGAALNRTLARTAALTLIFSLLMSFGWWW